MLVGIGVSLNGMVPGSALLARWYRERLSTAIGIAFSAVGVGTMVFVPLAQYLIGEYDWRAAYRIMGSALLRCAGRGARCCPGAASPPATRRTSRTGRKARGGLDLARRDAHAGVLGARAQVFFCTATAMFSVMVQLVAFLVDAGFSPLTAASAFGVLGMLSGGSVMASGFCPTASATARPSPRASPARQAAWRSCSS